MYFLKATAISTLNYLRLLSPLNEIIFPIDLTKPEIPEPTPAMIRNGAAVILTTILYYLSYLTGSKPILSSSYSIFWLT